MSPPRPLVRDHSPPSAAAHSPALVLRFDAGTLLLQPADGLSPPLHQAARTALARLTCDAQLMLKWDPRVGLHRAPALSYGALCRALRGLELPTADRCHRPARVAIPMPRLRPYQQRALEAWRRSGRGTVVLPTGAGKTHVALGALGALGRATLVLVPTRALLGQWHRVLEQHGAGRVGQIGDGRRELRPVTVCTFASAFRHADGWGDRFALLVVDEAHHVARASWTEALQLCTAPFRLGLSATPPGADRPAQRARLAELVGPVVYRRAIGQLSGGHLAPLECIRVPLTLSPAEQAAYEAARGPFRVAFATFQDGGGGSWPEFVEQASRSAAGRRGLAGFFESRRIVALAAAKLELAHQLLRRHADERVLIFTADNRVAYATSRRLLVPAITCDIKRAERRRLLAQLAAGTIRALVSARVLNEGLDIPEASVGLVLGGSGGGQEHVQRVGRLLRPRPHKRALVYELVASGTYEVRQARQRRACLAC